MLCSASTTTKKLQILTTNTLNHKTLFNKKTLNISNYINITPTLNFTNLTHSLIINYNYQNTSLIPIINKKINSTNYRKININKTQLNTFIQKLLQLKYPNHITTITLNKTKIKLPTIFIN